VQLTQELIRLFRVQNPVSASQETPAHAGPVVRALVLEIARPADWTALSAVWYGAQTDLELPAAAIAVSGTDGLQLWFSTAMAVPAREAAAFLQGLQQRYLPAIPSQRVQHYPQATAADTQGWSFATEVPALQPNGNWSAFISADLPAVFADEPWLDIPPNSEQQADILGRIRPITPGQFQYALSLLGAAASTGNPPPPASSIPMQSEHINSPEAFLLQVMNDPRLDMQHRIEAAKALLAHGNKTTAP